MIILRNKYFGPDKTEGFAALAKQFKKVSIKKTAPKPDPRWPWTNL